MKPRSALQQAKVAEATHEANLVKSLRRPVVNKSLPSVIGVANDILSEHRDVFGKTFNTSDLPKMATFSRSLKTKDYGKVRLAVASHLFARYSIPRHLQEVWWKFNPRSTTETAEHRWNRNIQPFLGKEERIVRERWAICAALGGSLYKEYAKEFMTKKEVHTFLTCPLNVSFEEALLYALAASHTDDLGLRTRILKSKLIQKRIFLYRQDVPGASPSSLLGQDDARQSAFWRDVIRFFCVNPVPISEMNNLIDYFAEMYGQQRRVVNGVLQPEWSPKGRTIHALQEAMKQWHRDLGRVNRMGNRTWDGVGVPDAFYKDEVHSGTRTDWSVMQIKSSKLLAAEGNQMHHCVYSYQTYCISGRTSIWSLKRKPAGKASDFERAITIEVNNHSGEIVQIRGYANRLARDDEMQIIRKWAAENGMLVRNRGW